jgi:enamine deaminase RidA (YjgF/YER057c/UK114 family)
MNIIKLAVISPLVFYAVLCSADEISHTYLSPESVPPAMGQYSLGVSTSENMRWVHVAGQTGIRKDGSVPKDFETQTRIIIANIKAILKEAEMQWTDVVSYNIYMTHREDLQIWRKLAPELLAGAKPAGTLVLVSGLVHPDWRIEIEVKAAKRQKD